MVTVRISSKGQIAIPKSIRDKVGLEEGTALAIVVRNQDLVMRKVPSGSWRRWRGALKGTNVLEDLEREHREEINQDEEHARKAQGS
ncbi:MAG: AbrB/MazE/SpoVT family DNA-binding domain-containing protein [Acidobacteria bacterium]|nr:AbrB/MazE/SpoVT family DNA-binding domain-containing protein [Acidobacteriota bacterium]MBI3655510.1 AbrB/MazE/SpoVT family DNA-binding domain-containing protein [Acidobacteriota bacterium]